MWTGESEVAQVGNTTIDSRDYVVYRKPPHLAMSRQ
jgi:hypothetical protein